MAVGAHTRRLCLPNANPRSRSSRQPVIDLEWEIVYDTLLRARKQLEFAAWRTEEQSRKLTLSPSYFRVGDNDSAPEQATSLSAPLWLSTREGRRNWIDVLEARIAQETTIAAGSRSAVSSVEEATLPLLRDALLDAADLEGSLVAGPGGVADETTPHRFPYVGPAAHHAGRAGHRNAAGTVVRPAHRPVGAGHSPGICAAGVNLRCGSGG